MKHIKDVPVKGGAWGVAAHNDHPDHFFTGYVNGSWRAKGANMELGRNVILEGAFVIESMSRGHSAAKFHGYFKGAPDVKYLMGVRGTTDLLMLVQAGRLKVGDGAFEGQWTFAKQGCDILLTPVKTQ